MSTYITGVHVFLYVYVWGRGEQKNVCFKEEKHFNKSDKFKNGIPPKMIPPKQKDRFVAIRNILFVSLGDWSQREWLIFLNE